MLEVPVAVEREGKARRVLRARKGIVVVVVAAALSFLVLLIMVVVHGGNAPKGSSAFAQSQSRDGATTTGTRVAGLRQRSDHVVSQRLFSWTGP